MLINYIKDIKSFIKEYKLVLCDLWGVVHNGEEVFLDSLHFLQYLRDSRIKVILFSNAPRPNKVVRSFLINKINLPEDLFHSVVSSGDVSIEMINKLYHGKNYFHMGPPKDYDLLEGIEIQNVDILNNAEFVLCTGLDDDELETPANYKDILIKMIKLNLPMVCVNPDIIAFRGDKKIFCAGSIAELYSKMGGTVKYYGKPYQEMYTHALEKAFAEGLVENKSQIIAIGDSLGTDIKGANNFGINSIFVETGIHKDEIINEIDNANFFNSYFDKKPSQMNIIKTLKI